MFRLNNMHREQYLWPARCRVRILDEDMGRAAKVLCCLLIACLHEIGIRARRPAQLILSSHDIYYVIVLEKLEESILHRDPPIALVLLPRLLCCHTILVIHLQLPRHFPPDASQAKYNYDESIVSLTLCSTLYSLIGCPA